ncbi:MAG TPA: FIST N-terminal domain-containing protein [Kineosporiaceae bacterium]|nr:FIST N-terminal domain-containing protein [Kineosporiaceae bacterium]
MISNQAVETKSIVMTSAASADLDPARAAAALVEELGTEAALYAVFVTAGYPRGVLAEALDEAWGGRLIGCTSAGNIGPGGFVSAPVMAVALSGGDLRAETVVIEPLSELATAIERVTSDLERLRAPEPGRQSFALMLVDGLSRVEEQVAAGLKSVLGPIPMIGGSAGDDLSFIETAVLGGGSFAADRATLTVLSTTAPFRAFRIQHYQAGEEILVITEASPDERLVHQINGMPAAEAFAEAIGVPVADLRSEHFSKTPLLLRAGGETWIRSIFHASPDGTLQFFASIDTGAVLRLGSSGDAERLMREEIDAIGGELGGPVTGALTFDCVLRRSDFSRTGLNDAISQTMSQYRMAGFSTYGEQFDDFHMNQTMVGVAFGG